MRRCRRLQYRWGHRAHLVLNILVREQIYAGTEGSPLVIPEEAVVVPGSRAISRPVAKRWGMSLYTPINC